MERAKVWFRCAAMHDPVTPVIRRPALIGWEAKERKVDLCIERAFNGEELVRRMRGWVTVNVEEVLETVKACGRFVVLDDQELVLETESREQYEDLEKKLAERFGDQLELERL